jgi:hypothetical protein
MRKIGVLGRRSSTTQEGCIPHGRPHSRLHSNRWRGWQKQSGSVPRHKDCCWEHKTEEFGKLPLSSEEHFRIWPGSLPRSVTSGVGGEADMLRQPNRRD